MIEAITWLFLFGLIWLGVYVTLEIIEEIKK